MIPAIALQEPCLFLAILIFASQIRRRFTTHARAMIARRLCHRLGHGVGDDGSHVRLFGHQAGKGLDKILGSLLRWAFQELFHGFGRRARVLRECRQNTTRVRRRFNSRPREAGDPS